VKVGGKNRDLLSRMGRALTSCQSADDVYSLSATGPELQGVLHASGVLQDATLPKQTAAGVRAVYGPKVSRLLSAVVMHAVT
jgi:KR domain